MKHFSYFKIVDDEIPGRCWFCYNLTFGCLLDNKTGEDCFCCQPCAKKHGKIRKFRFRDYSSNNEKSFKISQNLSIGTKEKLILGGAKNA